VDSKERRGKREKHPEEGRERTLFFVPPFYRGRGRPSAQRLLAAVVTVNSNARGKKTSLKGKRKKTADRHLH